jgi:hypothetical protein
MSTKTVKVSNVKAVPFFARFLEEQAAQSDTAPMTTLKYPSDWEER